MSVGAALSSSYAYTMSDAMKNAKEIILDCGIPTEPITRYCLPIFPSGVATFKHYSSASYNYNICFYRSATELKVLTSEINGWSLSQVQLIAIHYR